MISTRKISYFFLLIFSISVFTLNRDGNLVSDKYVSRSLNENKFVNSLKGSVSRNEQESQCNVLVFHFSFPVPTVLCDLFSDDSTIRLGRKKCIPFLPTASPTVGSTFEPTKFRAVIVTAEASCIEGIGSSEFGPEVGIFKIDLAPMDKLCTLGIKSMTNGLERVAPLARSYDGNDWHSVAGPAVVGSTCDQSTLVCEIRVPRIDEESEVFIFTAYTLDSENLKSEDIAARFFEQTTFGSRREDLATWYNQDISGLNYQFSQWIKNQIDNTPATSFRSIFREQASTTVRTAKDHGVPVSLCEENTRWHSYSLTRTDATQFYDFLNVTHTSDGKYYLFTINGVPRTEVESVEVLDYGNLTVPGIYEFCEVWKQGEYLGGPIAIKIDDSCYFLANGNPPIKFLSSSPEKPPNIIAMNSPSDIGLFQPVARTVLNEEFILPQLLPNVDCTNISLATYPVYLDFGDGSFLSFDPRLKLLENTVEDPNPDGGGESHLFGALCSNVARTFLNEEHCQLSSATSVCSNEMVVTDAAIMLDHENLLTLFDLTSRYVYAIIGLRVEESPCVRGRRSRWERISNTTTCPGGSTTFSDNTGNTLSELIGWSVNGDFWYKDIVYWDLSKTCNEAASTPSYEPGNRKDIKVTTTSSCWQLVHADEYSVYDMTPWINLHPGGAEKITQNLDGGGTILTYPHPGDMDRWESNKHLFPYAGRYNNNAPFYSFPPMTQLQSVIDHFDLEVNTGENVIVCGSPNEIANNQTFGETGLGMSIGDAREDLLFGDRKAQRQVVWLRTVMSAGDQLRQRVAWALRQLFATSPTEVGENENSEGFLNFYDIFVRHAFGNYFDILKEVAYSPHMAEQLTFLRSQSTQYTLRTRSLIVFADENFAREIMQLFTIGTVMLNIDGTPIKDPETRRDILSYNNEHVMSYARAWTGFDRQFRRGNIELSGRNPNRIDPMQIIPDWRDTFAKIDLEQGYIGDGYPVCGDMPEKAFLRKGAKYRLLGSSTQLQLTTDPPSWQNYDPLVKNVKLDPSSNLYNALCSPSTFGGDDCDFKSQVEITENLICFDQECRVDTLHLIEVTDGIFFEYVRQACVEFTFYQNPKTITEPWRTNEMCGDPKTAVAAEACCTSDDEFARAVNCEYSNERVTFETARERCAAIGQAICPFNKLLLGSLDEICGAEQRFHHWHDSDCLLKAKVKLGYVAVIHKPTEMINENIQEMFNDDSFLFFPVHWNSVDYPNELNNCGNGACEERFDGCLCNTTVTEEVAFMSRPTDLNQVLSTLNIGSVSPDTYDDGYYDEPIVEDNYEVYFKNGESYNTETIFKVEMNSEIKYYKNMISTVQIIGDAGQVTSYSFRNPPHFMNFVRADERDAHYETEAVLKSYFHHQNVAPKIATHLIQRFGISNPSPRYVKNVALAFKNGLFTYEESPNPAISFGTSKYGDMQSTIAALLLDEEARSLVLEKDPSHGSLREPLLKFVNFMRAMEYSPFEFFGSAVYSSRLKDVTSRMGQMVFEMKDVFSFFNPDYSPSGSIEDASLVSPEAQVYTAPSVVGIINGIFSLAKYGLSSCYGGFGNHIKWCGRVTDGDFSAAWGNLTFSFEESTDAENIVNELATILTAGRLNSESRNIIAEKVANESDTGKAARLAQQLVAVTPEFHSTSRVEFNGEDRMPPEEKTLSSEPYKAIIYFLASGGMDSYNLIVPHSDCQSKDLYEEYASVRSTVALSKNRLLQIDASGSAQECNKFGVHPDLPILKELYGDTELTFFANVGVLFQDVTPEDWTLRTPTQLFAHNTQQKDTQQVDALQAKAGTGVLGRMADVLTSKGFNIGSYSMSSPTFTLVGEPKQSPGINFVDPNGFAIFNEKPSRDDMNTTIAKINNPTTFKSGLYSKQWSEVFDESLRQTETLASALSDISLSTTFPNSVLGKSMKQVSSIIKARETLGQNRQLFFVESGGWDTHAQQPSRLSTLNRDLNDCIRAFSLEMKAQNLWDNVVFVMASDFGRTLVANSGQGTDHAWGGNYFALGGSMNGRGGKILGKYPDDLTDDGPLNIDRGRLIPTTSWDAIMNGVAEWFGIEGPEELKRVVPNRNRFDVFSREDFFADDS